MKALVTGLSGFTGYYLKRELEAAGREVVGLASDLTQATSVMDEVGSVQPEVVVHLAGIAFVGHGHADSFYQVNLMGTRNLLVALTQLPRPPRCVLLVSSANVYGNRRGGLLDEKTDVDPANDYAVSKLAMEYMSRLWMDRLPIVIVRPFNYTGVGQSELFVVPKIIGHLLRGEEVIELGNLDVWRDFSDVRAVVEAYVRLLDRCPAGEVVNVCSGRAYCLREVVSTAEAIAGRKLRIEVNPRFVRENELSKLCGDPSKLRSWIGEWDTPSLEETLHWMLNGNLP